MTTKLPQSLLQGSVDPINYGASSAAADTVNDTAFAELAAAATGEPTVDLAGQTYAVTAVPSGIYAINGFFKVTDLDETADICLPAYNTMNWYECQLDAGQIGIAWAQDTMASYNGLVYLGYMAALGHNPGTKDWTIATSKNGCKDFSRIEEAEDFGYSGVDVAVFSAGIVPPSTSGGSYDGAFQIALAVHGSLLDYTYRALAEYEQDGTTGGIDQAESAWSPGTVSGVTMGAALRAAVDSAYSVTTSGLPTVVHSLGINGSSLAAAGNFYYGFHGLSGASTGPHICYTNGTPKDGTATISYVGRIGLLTEGVEPTVAWFQETTSSRLCGFIRSQGDGYPIRFWATDTLSQAGIEGAATQDAPFGNDMGTLSPVPCRMRPRRQGTVSGWLATSETLDGTDSDELHFAFTGERDRDGSPGTVGLYWGSVTKGSGLFETLWTRAKIVKIADLYFSRGNVTSSSNQVGIPSLTFSDANTLHIAASTESPAIAADYDGQALMKVITIKLNDTYADAAERKIYDDGTTRPVHVQRVTEYTDY